MCYFIKSKTRHINLNKVLPTFTKLENFNFYLNSYIEIKIKCLLTLNYVFTVEMFPTFE